jgi:ubiquinone/menaquinone biosynthesis C-methylase UbiE
MRFYKDIIAHAETPKDSKTCYHNWSPQNIKFFWTVCSNNPFTRAQYYPKDYWIDLLDWTAKKISIRPSVIVDIGCGTGNLIDCITNCYGDASIYGVDLSEDSLEPAKQRFKTYKNIHFKIGSLDRLPFEDRSIDLITCTEVLEHTFPEIFTQAFAEVNRALKKDGYFVASVPFDEKIAFVCCPGCGSVFTPYQHMIFEISRDDIRDLLSNNNLELVGFYQSLDRSLPNNKLKRVLKPAVIKWLPNFAARIFPKAGVSGFLARKRT